MKRLSKDGSRTYNVGSERGWGLYPRVCACGCGQPLRVTKDAIWFEATDGGRLLRSWHFQHRLAA
jgi:hypothetical protein